MLHETRNCKIVVPSWKFAMILNAEHSNRYMLPYSSCCQYKLTASLSSMLQTHCFWQEKHWHDRRKTSNVAIFIKVWMTLRLFLIRVIITMMVLDHSNVTAYSDCHRKFSKLRTNTEGWTVQLSISPQSSQSLSISLSRIEILDKGFPRSKASKWSICKLRHFIAKFIGH